MPSKIPFLKGALFNLIGQVVGRRVVDSNQPAFWFVDRDITAAEIIAGSVTILPDGSVPDGCIPFMDDYEINWGGVAFTTATDIRISDTTAAKDFVTVAIANTINALHRKSPTGVTQTGVTQGAPLIGAPASLGGVAGKGLLVRSTGSAPAAGSTFRVRAQGYFAKS